jgi:hypothetical protein
MSNFEDLKAQAVEIADRAGHDLYRTRGSKVAWREFWYGRYKHVCVSCKVCGLNICVCEGKEPAIYGLILSYEDFVCGSENLPF